MGKTVKLLGYAVNALKDRRAQIALISVLALFGLTIGPDSVDGFVILLDLIIKLFAVL